MDAPQAKRYLTDLMTVIERPQDAQTTHSHLAKMNVKGSLLRSPLRLLQQYPQVKVERISLSQSESPGTVNMQGSFVVQTNDPQTAQPRTVRYRVAAEFLGTREGTALAHLDIKEMD